VTTFIVSRKSNGVEVDRYSNDVIIELPQHPFADFDYAPEAIEEVTDPTPQPLDPTRWRIWVGSFFDRFGDYKIGILASVDPLVQAVIKDASVRRYIDLVQRRDELMLAVGLLQSKGFAVDPVAILDVEPVDDEVWRGN